ncbi:MAG: hypothetical protein ACI96M_003797, partial [Candidatus Azotimanducaceae bacterium]
MDETQQYWFDSQGYFIVPGVLDGRLIEFLRSTMGPATEQHDPAAKEDNPLHWSKAWREIMDLPILRPILESLVGNHALRLYREDKNGEEHLPTYRLDHINVHQHVAEGFAGMNLHGGWVNAGGSQFFRYHDGK